MAVIRLWAALSDGLRLYKFYIYCSLRPFQPVLEYVPIKFYRSAEYFFIWNYSKSFAKRGYVGCPWAVFDHQITQLIIIKVISVSFRDLP